MKGQVRNYNIDGFKRKRAVPSNGQTLLDIGAITIVNGVEVHNKSNQSVSITSGDSLLLNAYIKAEKEYSVVKWTITKPDSTKLFYYGESISPSLTSDGYYSIMCQVLSQDDSIVINKNVNNYILVGVAASQIATITDFRFLETDNGGRGLNPGDVIICSVNENSKTITKVFSSGVILNGLKPRITWIDNNATISPGNLVAQNFESSKKYTVTAEAGNKKEYNTYFSVASLPKAIYAGFSLNDTADDIDVFHDVDNPDAYSVQVSSITSIPIINVNWYDITNPSNQYEPHILNPDFNRWGSYYQWLALPNSNFETYTECQSGLGAYVDINEKFNVTIVDDNEYLDGEYTIYKYKLGPIQATDFKFKL